MSSTQYVDVTRSLQNLEDEIDPENIEAIRDFINHQAAEGIGETQQTRQIQSLKTILKKFAPSDFQLRGMTMITAEIVDNSVANQEIYINSR